MREEAPGKAHTAGVPPSCRFGIGWAAGGVRASRVRASEPFGPLYAPAYRALVPAPGLGARWFISLNEEYVRSKKPQTKLIGVASVWGAQG